MPEVSVFTFGEILWDCLPSGRHAGGAPFNVAVHLAQLGVNAALVSSVGVDALGDELLSLAMDKGVDTRFIGRARSGLPTGIVVASLDSQGKATYDIRQPSAWDEIPPTPELLEALPRASAFVFGSLACRSQSNAALLRQLLATPGPMRCFDVNLRAPFIDPKLVMELAGQSDLLKLNDEELGQLASWLRSGEMRQNVPETEAALADACKVLSTACRVPRICVTRGANGAAFWDGHQLTCVAAPTVQVVDTIGAGDAFMAALVLGMVCRVEIPIVLEFAARLGAYVASQTGATPPLAPELQQPWIFP